MAVASIVLPLNAKQVFELANQLPASQKKRLVKLLTSDEENIDTTEAQKQFVRNSVKKYKKNPELLLAEEDAWKIINSND